MSDTPTPRQEEALRALLADGARIVVHGSFGGGSVGSIYIKGNTLCSLQSHGWIETDEIEHGPEKTVKIGFGSETQTIRPVKRVTYRITDAGIDASRRASDSRREP